ncbi:hypothetical protein FH972_026208 [Carpinus fangiana]|uniref:Indole-diterpene biosynthesis protein PaxU n=1 Tax=Carpinus fangiana TaxID=176857 RepID=A0A5N6L3P2_9ROSI|nr:hypothetical protein FH972_026208 [Carpinus fangiana]
MTDQRALTSPNGLLADFSKIGDWVYLLERRTSQRPASQTSPSLIVLLAWLDASPRHTRMYIAHYSLRHPAARIVVVFTNKVHLFLHGQRAQLRRLQPVLDAIVAAQPASWSDLGNSMTNGILIHAFSNGGAMQLACLLRLHATKYSKPLSATMVVFDSCPGVATYRRSVAALTYSLPRQRILALLVGSIVVSTLTLLFGLGILLRKLGLRDNNNSILRMRSDLMDYDLLCTSTRLVYLYSHEDKMISGEDVENHMAEARRKGYNTTNERFHGSKHVAHAFTFPERYWTVVEGTWDERTIGMGNGEFDTSYF